jgi:hypothetical protein
MPEGVIQCFESCPATGSRVRTGYRVRRGFSRLISFEGGVAGRFIRPGWTGVSPDVGPTPGFPYYFPSYGTPPQVAAAAGVSMPPTYHEAGDVVLYRTDENTTQVYTANAAGFGWPGATGNPGLISWAPGGAATAAVNTWIANGFWRDGVSGFEVGDLVYECTPSADESDDDFAVELFVCIATVSAAGRPSQDVTHFRPFWDTGSRYEQHHIYAGLSTGSATVASVVPRGQVVPVFQAGVWEFYRAHGDGALSTEYGQLSKFHRVAMGRPMFDRAAWAIARCSDGEVNRRWRRMVVTSVIEGIAESATVYRVDADGGVRIEADGGLLSWGAAPANAYGTRGGNFPYFWRGAQGEFPKLMAESWEPRIRASRLRGVEFSATRMVFTWEVVAERWVPHVVTGDPATWPVYFEGEVRQEVALEDEYTLEELWGDVVMPPWGDFGAAGGGSGVEFDEVAAVTVAASPLQTPQRDPRLVVREAQHVVLGPRYCERVSHCNGAATRCRTVEVSGDSCAGQTVSYAPALSDLGTTTTVQDNCECAP